MNNPGTNLTFDFLSPRNLKSETNSRPKFIWAVGGGKGGTGKTLLSANLGVKLAQTKGKVLLVDADLGGANLHTCLGLPSPKKTLGDFLSRNYETLDEVIIDTEIGNLGLVNGSGDMYDVANLKHSQKMRFIRQFKDLDAKHVILDLGAGTNFNNLDFFISADIGIVVVMPEPTSIENSYRFLKGFFYRKIRGVVSMPMLRTLVDRVISQKERERIKTPYDLLKKIELVDKATFKTVESVVQDSRVMIVMNQVRNPKDLKIGEYMARACKRYFGINAKFVGSISHEEAVWKSVQSRRPVTLAYPDSIAAGEISGLAEKLLKEAEKIRANA